MSKSIVNTVPYPFQFDEPITTKPGKKGVTQDASINLKSIRGRIPSIQASRLRSMMLEASRDPSKILAHCCSYDGLSSRLVEEAGFPMIFLAGYPVASAYGLPDTGYIAMAEMCDKIQEAVRQTTIPVMADGDTGYGSPMNVKRTVESYAEAGAAGIMIEDQTWPKRMSFTWVSCCVTYLHSDQVVATPRAKLLSREARRTHAFKLHVTREMRERTSLS